MLIIQNTLQSFQRLAAFRLFPIIFLSHFSIELNFSSSVMPIEHLYIARVIDGLILVASMDHASSTGSNQQMEVYKSQV